MIPIGKRTHYRLAEYGCSECGYPLVHQEIDPLWDLRTITRIKAACRTRGCGLRNVLFWVPIEWVTLKGTGEKWAS